MILAKALFRNELNGKCFISLILKTFTGTVVYVYVSNLIANLDGRLGINYITVILRSYVSLSVGKILNRLASAPVTVFKLKGIRTL